MRLLKGAKIELCVLGSGAIDYRNRLIFDVAEVEKLTMFCQLFNTAGLFACLAPSGSPLMKWLPLSVFPALTPTSINGTPAYAVELADALTIDARQDFAEALAKLCKS